MTINELSIDMIGLSTRSVNALHRAQVHTVGDLLTYTEEQLYALPSIGKQSVEEILSVIGEYIHKADEAAEEDFFADYPDVIVRYTKANDLLLEKTSLSNRSKNQLAKNGLMHMSDIVLMTVAQLQRIPAMGPASVKEVTQLIAAYRTKHEERIRALCTGDETALIADQTVNTLLSELFVDVGLDGCNGEEIVARLADKGVSAEQVKAALARMLEAAQLSCTKQRYYRVYGAFADCLEQCPHIKERNREIVRKRLDGKTLEEIGKENGGLSRERIRQVISKAVSAVRDWHAAQTGDIWFDEDYYRYFFSTYAFEEDGVYEWLGIAPEVFRYLEMAGVKEGTADLQKALEDPRLSTGLRVKIERYLNRNKVLVGGELVEKDRTVLEEVAVRILCEENMPFEEFAKQYNIFLEEHGIEFDPKLYYTPEVLRSRKNRLTAADFLLWKQNETIRYYDIKAQDYTELLQTIGMESYENTELSTAKWIREYPQLMKRYDIRDAYELHNLLRKIVPEGAFHNFHCGRTPYVRFGTFSRDEAVMDLLIEHAPIEAMRFCELLQEEFGYDLLASRNYLKAIDAYLHQGVYTIDQKVMPAEHQAALKAVLTEDFYFIDEIRRLYRQQNASADPNTVNAYNLKRMGYTVLSRYVLTRHSSLDAFMRELLTKDDTTDLMPLKKRYGSVQAFYSTLSALKRERAVVEFEPNRLLSMRRLAQNGITLEDIVAYCDEVWRFASENAYFTVRSLQQNGFTTALEDFGFSDWFFSSLLAADERFSSAVLFNNYVFYKGKHTLAVQTFLLECVTQHGCIDVLDLMSELADVYGCRPEDRWDVLPKLAGTQVYFDKILDRLYANKDIYYRELDEEGLL